MKTKKYKCPNCKELVATVVPTEELVSEKGYWDSGVRCPHCDSVFLKKVWPSGKVEVFRIAA